MKWAVEIQRTTLDHRNLKDLLAGLGYALIDGVQFPAFTSPEVDQSPTAAAAFEVAKRVRAAFAGPAQIDPEFTLGSVIDYSAAPPTRHAFLEVQSCIMKVTMGTPTLTVSPPAGLSPEALAAWQKDKAEREYQAKLESQRSKLEPVFLEPRAMKLLEYMAIPSPSAEILYKIYELAEGHPSRRSAFHAQFGIAAADFQRFKDAVHNPAVSGDWARHAYHDAPKTTNPMTKAEAEGFVQAIAERWLAHVRAGLPP